MNKKGEEFIKEMNNQLKDFPKDIRKNLSKLNWGDSEIQERIMRSQLELNYYEISIDERDDLIDMARATIIKDTQFTSKVKA